MHKRDLSDPSRFLHKFVEIPSFVRNIKKSGDDQKPIKSNCVFVNKSSGVLKNP